MTRRTRNENPERVDYSQKKRTQEKAKEIPEEEFPIAQGRNHIKKIEIYLRRARALELRRQGYDYHAVARIIKSEVRNRTRDIASQLPEDMIPYELPEKYGYQSAKLDVDRILTELGPTVQENVAEAIELELSRLDELTTAFYPAALAGSSKAAEMIVKFMDRRAKYRGLWAPEVIQIEDWRTEIIALLKSGGIQPLRVIEEFGAGLGQELLLEAGVSLEETGSIQTGNTFVSRSEIDKLFFLEARTAVLDEEGNIVEVNFAQ